MRRVALLGGLLGCGRLHFADVPAVGTTADAFVEADSAFTPTTDAPAAAMTTRFGECASSDVTGVAADTHLDDLAPDDNAGRRREMRVGNNRVALIAFNLSLLSTTSTVFSATLEISVAADSLEAGYVAIYPMLEDWTEGAQDLSPGVANWTMRHAGTAWSVAGAGAPTSRATQVIGTFVPNLADTRHQVSLDPAAVQTWMGLVNPGMALVGIDDEAQGTWLVTSNNTDAAARPCLVITYVP